MARVPAVCRNNHVFNSGMDVTGHDLLLSPHGCQCPICREMGKNIDGEFRITDKTIEIINAGNWDKQQTFSFFKALNPAIKLVE